jgi:nitrilase
MCQALAREHKVFIHAGSILEKAPGEERLHNTSVAFNREGEEVARYRKIHMFDITAPDGAKYHESAAFKPGDSVVTYDCEGVTVGCAIARLRLHISSRRSRIRARYRRLPAASRW